MTAVKEDKDSGKELKKKIEEVMDEQLFVQARDVG